MTEYSSPARQRAAALTSVDGLVRQGLVPEAEREVLEQVAQDFRIRLSPAIRQIASAGVRSQFVPDPRELTVLAQELADPIGDDAHRPVAGLTHRYPDRVILHTTQICEVYCRFCFRREAVGETGQLAEAEFARVLDYLRDNPQIWEVILTGGDPLTLSTRRLKDMLERLAGLPGIEVIRFHTRIPVVAPEKITAELTDILQIRPAVWLVLHTNHADELSREAIAALSRLSAAGVPLLSQTVLLKGVNADPDTLEALFRKLIRNRVKPYYLHHPDLAKGTGHFRLSIAEGQKIMAALRGRISGTALPTYVLDIPGGYGKVPIGPGYLREHGSEGWIVSDPQGREHFYRDL